MTGPQGKIDRILDTLRQGTHDVRNNPSEANYRKWEGRIEDAGRDTPWARILLIGGMLSLFLFFAIVVFRSQGTSDQQMNSGCTLYNDNPYQVTVNVRSNCDTKPCGYDESTVIGEYPNNTPVRVNRSVAGRTSGRFTWIQVVLAKTGQTVWVASSKVRCQ